MPDPVKRTYDSSGRRHRAEEKRRAVLDTAADLFAERGYRATTMRAIAERAGVTAETIYTTIGTKPELFRLLVETSLSGTDDPVHVLERDYIREMAAEPDAEEKLRIYARAIGAIQRRMVPLYRAAREAAAHEPMLEQIWQELLERRARNMPLLLDALTPTGRVRPDLDRRRAADTVWAFNSTEVYDLLTRVRGWSDGRYVEWLADLLVRELLD